MHKGVKPIGRTLFLTRRRSDTEQHQIDTIITLYYLIIFNAINNVQENLETIFDSVQEQKEK